MLARLALGNVRKSLADFGIYFLTVMLGVAVFYAFNSMTAQQGVLAFSETQSKMFDLLGMVIGGVSVFIAFVLVFLVVYANSFLIKRRKREFGVYLALGMSTGDVVKIVALESLIAGAASLAAGLVVGIGLVRVVADAFQILGDHQHIEYALTVLRVLRDLRDKVALALVKQAVHHVIIFNNAPCKGQVTADKRIQAVGHHFNGCLRHLVDMRVVTARTGQICYNLRNIACLVTDTLDIVHHMEQGTQTVQVFDGQRGLVDLYQIVRDGMVQEIDIFLYLVDFLDVLFIQRDQGIHGTV